jgi:hypothetical protein
MSLQCSEQSKSGSRCRLRTRALSNSTGACNSSPICWIHLRSKTGLRVKTSTIPNSGKGLFTERNLAKGAPIGEYTGVTRPASAPRTSYDMGLTHGRKVDASDPLKSSVMRYANHKPRSSANARIMDQSRGTAANGCTMIRAAKPIRATKNSPTEIFTNYGTGYWRGRPKSQP